TVTAITSNSLIFFSFSLIFIRVQCSPSWTKGPDPLSDSNTGFRCHCPAAQRPGRHLGSRRSNREERVIDSPTHRTQLPLDSWRAQNAKCVDGWGKQDEGDSETFFTLTIYIPPCIHPGGGHPETCQTTANVLLLCVLEISPMHHSGLREKEVEQGEKEKRDEKNPNGKVMGPPLTLASARSPSLLHKQP
ncbi:hypothetical protein CH063_02734, partial [Colletotrichum higginsianum]